jgi:hypothetical protein
MLIATLIVLLFIGSGANFMQEDIDKLEDRIKAEFGDDTMKNARLNAALDVVDNMDDTTEDYADFDTDQEKELIKLIQQYDSTATDIQGNMDISYQRRVEYQQHMLTLHRELKGKLSRDDWSKLFSADKDK